MAKFNNLSYELSPLSSFSLDLAFSDYPLFSKFTISLGKSIFRPNDEIMAQTIDYFRDLDIKSMSVEKPVFYSKNDELIDLTGFSTTKFLISQLCILSAPYPSYNFSLIFRNLLDNEIFLKMVWM